MCMPHMFVCLPQFAFDSWASSCIPLKPNDPARIQPARGCARGTRGDVQVVPMARTAMPDGRTHLLLVRHPLHVESHPYIGQAAVALAQLRAGQFTNTDR